MGSVEIDPSQSDLEAGRSAYRMDLEVMFASEPKIPDRLATLEPSGTYEFDRMVSIPVNREGYTGPGGVAPGRHFVRLTVDPFVFDDEQRRQLEARFSSKAVLWAEPTHTVPMAIDIPKQRHLVRCEAMNPASFRIDF